jgi:hypothetical protein
MGSLGNIIDQTTIAEAAVNESVSQDHNNFRNIFNYSLWDKTEPMSVHFKVILYSKTDPLVDVVIPAYMMMSHAGIDKILNTDGTSAKYGVPGVSFNMAMSLYNKSKNSVTSFANASIKANTGLPPNTYVSAGATDEDSEAFVFKRRGNNKDRKIYYSNKLSFNSKVLAFLIDGLVYIDVGMIKNVSVTCSKHTAKTKQKFKPTSNTTSKPIDFEGDFPIWMELDLHIESTRPAISYMLWNSLNGKNILARPNEQYGYDIKNS